MTVRGAALAALALVACGQQEITRIDVGSLGLDAVVLLITDERLDPVRVVATNTPLEDGERAFVVGVTRATLATAEPQLARAAVATFTLELTAPTPAITIAPAGAEQVARFAVPATAVIVDAALGPAPRSLLDALTARVTLPADDGAPEVLRPFGAAANLIPVGTQLPYENLPSDMFSSQLRHAVALSADRVLVMSNRFLGLVDRGQPFPRDGSHTIPAKYLHVADLSRVPGEYLMSDFALDATRTRGWAVGHLLGVGGIWTFAISDAGLIGTGSATVTPHAAWPILPQLSAVAVDGQGAVVVGGRDAIVLLQSPRATTFTARPGLFTGHRAWVTRENSYIAELGPIALSGVARAPHLIGTPNGRLIAGSAGSDEWSLPLDAAELSPRIIEPRVSGISAEPRTGELWVSTRGAGLFRRAGTDAPWTAVRLPIPPTLSACATTAERGEPWLPLLADVLLTETYAYVAIEECPAILRVRRDDGSTTAIHPTPANDRVRFLAVEPGFAGGPPLVVGGEGALYEITAR